jgi:hypothetical protein
MKPPRDHGGSFVFAFDQNQVVVDIHAFASFLGYGIIIANLGGGVKGEMKRHATRGRCVPFYINCSFVVVHHYINVIVTMAGGDH